MEQGSIEQRGVRESSHVAPSYVEVARQKLLTDILAEVPAADQPRVTELVNRQFDLKIAAARGIADHLRATGRFRAKLPERQ